MSSIKLAKDDEYSFYYNISLLFLKMKKREMAKKYFNLYLTNEKNISERDENEIKKIIENIN